MNVDTSNSKPLSPILHAAVEEFKAWSTAALSAEESANRITRPLYHYTDATGLEGIIKHQQVWFTHYLHLNDPSEVAYGMGVASKLLKEIGKAGKVTKTFCDMVDELFTHENMGSAFAFFIGSFSRESDDLGQWRAYGDDGRGFSLGLASRLFRVAPKKPDSKPDENVFVAPVVYGVVAGRNRFRPAIEEAIRIVNNTADQVSDFHDMNVGMRPTCIF